MAETRFTYCRICETRCGIAVTVEGNRAVAIGPDRNHAYNYRDFCVKGKTAAEVVEHPRRLRTPMKRVGDRYVEASWEEATREIGATLNRIIADDGADAVGMYNGNPWGYSFSHATFSSAWMEAIGSASRYNVGSIDQHSEMLVAELMYGSALMPLVPDVDDCDCFFLIGMNPAESRFNWVASAPDGWARVLGRQRDGAQVIIVDPRRTPSAERADIHLAIRPGQDWALLLAMLKIILDNGWTDPLACSEATGYHLLRELTADADLDGLATRCGIPPEAIEDVARRFGTARTAMAWNHTGVSQTLTGTVGNWLTHVLNLVTGRTDRPGGRRFERGFVDVAKLWDNMAPANSATSRVRGLPKVINTISLSELPAEITTPGPGQMKALIIDAGNPVVSGPDGETLDAALQELELLVCIDLVQRESHRHAHWLIPGWHWLERDEFHPLWGSLEERPFVQYAFRALDPPEGIKEEWEFFTNLALEMRRPLFGKPGFNAIVRSSRVVARLTGKPGLAFSPNWVTWAMLRMGGRLKWRDIKSRPHGWVYGEKEYGNLRKSLLTDDGRIQAAPESIFAEARRLLKSPPPESDKRYPLLLINRRRLQSMNSWTNELPGLFGRQRHNELEMHEDDAAALGLATGDVALVTSATGEVELPVRVSEAVRPGVVVSEHGWGSRIFDPHGDAEPVLYGANRNLLVSNEQLDPLSQIPALNGTPVAVAKATSRPPQAAPAS
ncbi:MAG: molybdopterin dinucleotide-binding region [Solirubrobacterales bacterium]|nr:molybdopterin dinucleotide-binding region [Solirubrobacterales bacterium]